MLAMCETFLFFYLHGLQRRQAKRCVGHIFFFLELDECYLAEYK